MLVLDSSFQPIDRLRPFVWLRRDMERSTHSMRLFGRLVAYLPHNHRAYYNWGLIVSYRPSQQLSIHQLAPAQLRVVLLARWEVGIILGHWLLGIRLKQPLAWFKRVQPA